MNTAAALGSAAAMRAELHVDGDGGIATLTAQEGSRRAADLGGPNRSREPTEDVLEFAKQRLNLIGASGEVLGRRGLRHRGQKFTSVGKRMAIGQGTLERGSGS